MRDYKNKLNLKKNLNGVQQNSYMAKGTGLGM
jgi:hypothetical protein